MPKKAIVLIRGLFREKRHWGDFPNLLQSEFPDKNIITLNVAGAGDRNHLNSPNTIAGMVDDFRSQLSNLYPGTTQIELIGLSMGGMIALEWCRRFPDEINRAILISTSTKSFSGFYQRLRWQQYGSLISSVIKSSAERERFSYELGSNYPVNDAVLSNWIQWANTNPMSSRSSFNQLIACMNFKIDHKPEVPMLVLVPKKDKMVNPECSYAIAERWKLPIKEHPSAGHDIPIDDPNWVIRHSKEFLATND
ncbi:alpha/beta fold hydrolase [Vibrio algarum]|uniref:Alpha/beta hydrolase n=1 Tax=Vibrio algarum TaxID=3020714 RepID=A0ABT4YWK9_9VIBR|nr:alpha/beta hydrolase [Vibrio sp. KJ40-1]MDB1125541.1 alpha/beta hydrolase [Vibrio sp. KJ40-1]